MQHILPSNTSEPFYASARIYKCSKSGFFATVVLNKY